MTKNLPNNGFFIKINIAFFLLKQGKLSSILHAIKVRFYSSNNSIGLVKYLNTDFEYPNPKIEFSTRLFKDEDINSLNENFRHIGFIKEKIPDCYTSVTKNNVPCYRMWVMKPNQNKRIKNYFKGIFPALNEDEALIEGVFTHPDYRGLKIMPNVIGEISKKIKQEGINKIIAFVDKKNIASLKGFKQSGFNPYLSRKTKWRFFIRTVTFEPIPKSLIEEYINNTKNLQ
ncbi:GNAT family N-acetyltransferase [Aquaticitalea lipolytica]|uniref:GNAT family N-acetyltransferase n=1 Tax=Aquaticitalea lipolytica TaxID=1247562 RepID=UPI0024BB1367|nr:GNAT family N-acetyltransferase [Aquaticitalea lipolytica]